MKLFVTAGNTQTPVDAVRCLTNIFSGKTGARIASLAYERGHHVTFATSHPDVLRDIPTTRERKEPTFVVKSYKTYEELETIMAREIGSGHYNAVIHAAAVNDYHVAGAFRQSSDGRMEPVTGGKIKGNHPELWLRLIPAAKLVDKIRRDWNFHKTLVKFKLEVGVSDAELIAIGEQSRIHSGADWLVANTLAGMNDFADLLGGEQPERVERNQLASRLLDAIGCMKLQFS